MAVRSTDVRYVLPLQLCHGVTTYLLRAGKEKVQPKSTDNEDNANMHNWDMFNMHSSQIVARDAN